MSDTASRPSPISAERFAGAPRLLIRASAGTGKTFQLSNRYLALLRKCSPDTILAVTFTRKAAGEILDRILVRLSEAVLDTDARKKLEGFLGGAPLSAAECEGLLESLVRQLNRVKVGTLDGFFSRLATSIPLEVGLPPNWSIADEHSGRALTTQALDIVLARASEATTRRLVHMLAKGDIPRSIARLMRSAIDTHFDVFRCSDAEAWRRIVPQGLLSADELEAALVQCEELNLSGHGRMSGARDEDVARFRTSQWEDFLTKGLAGKLHAGETTFYKKDIPGEVIAAYEPLLKHVRGLLLKIWADQIAAVHELLCEYSQVRSELQQATQELRFDDIAAALAARLSSVDARSLIHRLDADIDHLLLDEFQDTSLLQWDVLRPFVQQLDAKPDASFFCVGDVKQAIYGWRGGIAALFDQVEREVVGLSLGMLNESRRSSPAVIEVVNSVFQNLTRHPNLGDELSADVTAWQGAFPRHSTALEKLSGYVTVETAATNASDSESKRQACCARAADLAATLLQTNRKFSIGVLTRRNDMVGRVIHELAVRGIQASEEGGVRLTTSAPVQLIQSVLHFADHPGDTAALFHVAHSPLADLYGLKPEMTARDDNARAAAHRAASVIREELASHGYEWAMELWAAVLRPVCSARDWSRLKRLCGIAASYDSYAGLRPAEFATRIEDERVEEATASAVRVMTIHKSKGLEFDAVILPDLDFAIHDNPDVNVGSPGPAERPDVVLTNRNSTISSLLPRELRRAIDQQRRTDVHESLCCLYVAMTRAVHALHMVIAPQAPTKAGGTTVQRTLSGLVRSALVTRPDLPSSTMLFEHGDTRWFETLPLDSSADDVRPSVPPDEAEWGPIVFPAGGRVRGLETTSPSKAKRDARGVAATRLLADCSAAGRVRGSLWHLWCQRLEWLDGAGIDRDRLVQSGRAVLLSPSQLEAEADAFLQTVEQGDIGRMFDRTAVLAARRDLDGDVEVDCRRELGYALIEEGRRLSGAIDRLILFRRGGKVVAADVIDFKSDAAGAASPFRSAYTTQVRQYAAAVSRMFELGPDKVRLQLVWLADGKVEEISRN